SDDERGRTGAEDMRLVSSGLTAPAAHNLPRSAGRVARLASTDLRTATGAPRPADLGAIVAVSASSLGTTAGTTASAASLAASPLPTEAARSAWGSGGGTA